LGRGVAILLAAAALLAALAAAALAGASAPSEEPGGGAELPRGGNTVLPDYRVVGFYGAPQSPQLGELGIGSPKSAARRLNRVAEPYEKAGKPIYPAFELIAAIALSGPGSDGKYRQRQPAGVIRDYLRVAKERRLLLVLDIQPGRSTFIDEVKHLRGFLRNRNVGIAIDPEWNMGPHGVPGETIGHVSAGMVNRVVRFMNRIVRRHDLPQKLLVIHQFTEDMVRSESRIETPRGVGVVLNADGFGTPSQKRQKYEELAESEPFHPGFKLFYREDTNLMSPRQVLHLRPRPQFVVYE
jgi:hypothetical protein